MFKLLKNTKKLNFCYCKFLSKNFSTEKIPLPQPSRKGKSQTLNTKSFIDTKIIRTIGGNGGDGCISFLQLWANENAGPDGGDGGNGGHVVFESSINIKSLNNIPSVVNAEHGEKGRSKDCHGVNAKSKIIPVPVGTIVREKTDNKIVADLHKNKMMFVAARGGAGGKGNHFFTTDTQQAPKICEYGGLGEDFTYHLEIRSMAHIGLIGLPNAGKSTLLRAISRARPKVAPYPFTTLQPHLGVVQYDDYEQIAVADLPGLIEDSHKNRGLGIQFLRHAERCAILLFVIDSSDPLAYQHYELLLNEIKHFSEYLYNKPKLIAANKIDINDEHLRALEKRLSGSKIIPISAKYGTNILNLLKEIRVVYDEEINQNEDEDD